jgi:hypothetical protein
MVSPQKIKYCGLDINVALNPLEVILDVAFDSDNGAMSSYLNRSAVASESHDGRYKNTHRYKYDELFSPQFTIVKRDFSDFSQSEIRQVLKYLTQTDKPALLEVYYDKDSEAADFCAIGGWISVETYKFANNRTVGVVATFEAITPHAMSDLETIPITSSDNYKKTITVDTDDNQPVYPRITIQQKGTIITVPAGTTYNMYSDMIPNTVYHNGTTYYWKSDESALVTGVTEPDYGWSKVTRDNVYATTDEIKEETVYYYTSDQKYRWIDPYTFKSSTSDPKLATTGVKITNTHKNELGETLKVVSTVVKNNTATEQIILDGANKIISSTNTSRIVGDNFDWQWLSLYDGKNEITVVGNCDVTIEFREVRKMGEW